jgi:hypothetical protein
VDGGGRGADGGSRCVDGGGRRKRVDGRGRLAVRRRVRARGAVPPRVCEGAGLWVVFVGWGILSEGVKSDRDEPRC